MLILLYYMSLLDSIEAYVIDFLSLSITLCYVTCDFIRHRQKELSESPLLLPFYTFLLQQIVSRGLPVRKLQSCYSFIIAIIAV